MNGEHNERLTVRTVWRVALPLLMTILLASPLPAQLLDDFNDGNDDGWTHSTYPPDLEGGNWDATHGVYRLSSDSFQAGGLIVSELDLTSDPMYANGHWWTTVVREHDNSWFMLIMRSETGSGGSYQFGWHPGYGLFISRLLDDNIEILAQYTGFRPDVGTPYIIEAGAFEEELEMRAWAVGDERPEEPQLQAYDSIFPSGPHGIGAGAVLEGEISVTFDDVCFQAAAPEFSLEIIGDCPGEVTASVINASPGDLIAIVYGFNEGSAGPVPNCPGLYLDIYRPVIAGRGRADEQGEFSVTGTIPAGACGRVLVQAVNVTTCEKTEVEGM